MPPTPIIDVLAEVFRSHGFDTTSPAHPEDDEGRIHRIDLLAEKNGMDVLIAAATAPETTQRKITESGQLRTTLGIQYALVAATHPLDATTEATAHDHNVIIWDNENLARAIGRAVLLEVSGAEAPPIADLLTLAPMGELPITATRAADPEPVVPSFIGMDFETPDSSPSPVAEATLSDRHLETGRGWYLETRKPSTPAPETPTPAPSVAPTTNRILNAPGARMGIPTSTGKDPHTFTPPTGALLAPTIGKDAAAQAAKREIYSISSTRLRYHPKRLYHWSVEAFIEGQVDTYTLQGVCLVDLATKKLEVPRQWEAPRHLREGTFDVPVDHKPVRMEGEQAEQLVLQHVLDETARETTMQDDDSAGDYALTIKRRVRVSKEDVQVHDQGLHWCPVWWINGTNGEMEVDALSGDILHKQLQSTPSETILL
jgi:hypothetical protein